MRLYIIRDSEVLVLPHSGMRILRRIVYRLEILQIGDDSMYVAPVKLLACVSVVLN